MMVECAFRDDPGGMKALHRTIDDRHLEQRKARRQLLLLGMVVAVAVASLLQVSVLRSGAPMDFMARYAAGGLVEQGRTPMTGPSSSRPSSSCGPASASFRSTAPTYRGGVPARRAAATQASSVGVDAAERHLPGRDRLAGGVAGIAASPRPLSGGTSSGSRSLSCPCWPSSCSLICGLVPTGPGHPGAGGSDLRTGHHRQRHLLPGDGLGRDPPLHVRAVAAAQLSSGWSRLGVADVRSRPAQAAGRRTNRQGQPIG